MSPEMFVTGKSSSQTDIFAYGVILYEMITGRHPFFEMDAPHAQLARYIQYVDPPDILQRRPEATPELASVVRKALAKNPADRYHSVEELRGGLRTAAHTLAPLDVISPLSAAEAVAP